MSAKHFERSETVDSGQPAADPAEARNAEPDPGNPPCARRHRIVRWLQPRSSLVRDRSRAFKPSLSPANLLFMNERIKKLTEQASSLPPIERAELVEGILQTLDAADPNLDQLWVEEAKDRLAAYRRGEIEALDFDETLAKHASRP
jgi:Putative addiction module component